MLFSWAADTSILKKEFDDETIHGYFLRNLLKIYGIQSFVY